MWARTNHNSESEALKIVAAKKSTLVLFHYVGQYRAGLIVDRVLRIVNQNEYFTREKSNNTMDKWHSRDNFLYCLPNLF
jgi:hypothetical protein